MATSVDQYDQEILQRFHLSIEEIKSSKDKRRVYLVRDLKNQSLKILKINLAFPKKLEREYQFLRAAFLLQYKTLKTPDVYAHGPSFILMEYLDCVKYSRDTILEKNWNEKEVTKFLSALREFQSIPQKPDGFSVYERLKGKQYPVMRALEMWKQITHTLTFSQIMKLILLLKKYFFSGLFFKRVTTHYDFNTFNFTNLNHSEKMTLIDFEMGAYGGDNLYDLLYYISIPTVELNQWTFQKALLKEWITDKCQDNFFVKTRIRVILSVISFQRIRRFDLEPEKAKVYRNNLNLLLSSESFNAWYQNVCESK